MILGPGEAIAEGGTLLLAGSILIVGAQIVRFGHETAGTVVITPEILEFDRPVRVGRAKLSTHDGRLDLHFVDAESQIIGVQGPEVRHAVRRNVGGLGRRGDIDRSVRTLVHGNDLSFVEIGGRVFRSQFRLHRGFALGDQERRATLVTDAKPPSLRGPRQNRAKVHDPGGRIPSVLTGLQGELSDR